MRVLSFFLALFLHVLAGLAFLGVSFAPKIHVDLNSRVYDVVLVNLPREKKIPDPVKQPPAVKKVDPVKQAPAARPKKKEVAAKPVKPQPRAVPKSPKKEISPEKGKPAAKPKAEVKKQEDARAELEKALGSASKIVREQKEHNEQQLERELAALQKSVQPQSGQGEGRATLIEIYSAQVKLLIQKNWRWPGFQDMALEARVVVNLSPEGKILGRKLGRSSGRADFDSSVLRAVDETKTLPLPPKDVRVLELNFNAQETSQ